VIPNKIIIHHSLTKDNQTVSWGAIRRYHTEVLGWSDIGYHAGCELLRDDYEVLIGRSWDEQGAHTKGQNFSSLGFCFIGNFDDEPPPSQQIITGARVIAYWVRFFDIPVEKIYPHSHFASYKTCPGKKFDMEELKAWVINFCERRKS